MIIDTVRMILSVVHGGVVRTSNLQPMSQVRVSATPLHVWTWASCSHTCASVHQAV